MAYESMFLCIICKRTKRNDIYITSRYSRTSSVMVDRTMGPWIGHSADVTSNPSDLRSFAKVVAVPKGRFRAVNTFATIYLKSA